jgi:UPF0755 protein
VKQALTAITLLLLTVICASAWWFWTDMQTVLNSPMEISTDRDFTIEPGMGLQSISNRLRDDGLIRQPYYLVIEARLTGKEGKVKAGEYVINPGTSPRQLLDQFVTGKVKQYELTLIEGWTFAQMMESISANTVLIHTLDSKDSKSVMTALGHPELSSEGQFFPDTYHFPKGTTDTEFLQRAYQTMQKILAEEWNQRANDLPYQTIYEALVMASLIEKETGLKEERAEIAGVFVRRLQKSMKLQTDPTVIYAMGETFDGNIKHQDLSIDSPYNTYVYTGLPPTPIALPGRDAIHAAMHPADGNTLYFVARGDGSHHFSETLNEHNKAVARYQLDKQEQ